MSAGYLQVTMYMSKVFHLQSASVIVGKYAGIFQLFQIMCQHSIILLVVQVLHLEIA